ncbi:uncharacterized protein [Acropora muricata]|uniref:uncharacterized protein n=1 Tax=Acropora muricata TaxID=159855 RepID=UPI0034E497A3
MIASLNILRVSSCDKKKIGKFFCFVQRSDDRGSDNIQRKPDKIRANMTNEIHEKSKRPSSFPKPYCLGHTRLFFPFVSNFPEMGLPRKCHDQLQESSSRHCVTQDRHYLSFT